MAKKRSRSGVRSNNPRSKKRQPLPEPRGEAESTKIAGVEFTSARLVIEYGTERQLLNKLQRVLDLLQPSAQPSGGATLKASESSLEGAVAGQCLDFVTATQVGKDAVGDSNFDLEAVQGDLYASEDELLLFRERVFRGVLDHGCEIDRNDIPANAENTQREVRDAIKQTAS